ncbi:hypothetical protein B296_00028367, partial [Ensete ventricosum]
TLPWGTTPAAGAVAPVGGRAGRGRQSLADALQPAPFTGTALQACVPTGGYRPYGLLPLWATTHAGCCPYERRRPLLRAAAPVSGAGLPCGLAQVVVGRPCIGVGCGWPPLLLASFTTKI